MTVKLICQKASQIQPAQTTWLIPNVVPEQSLTILFGLPKKGKSQIAYSMAAAVSNGSKWANYEKAKSGAVIVLNVDETTRKGPIPRLTVARANLDRVSVVTGCEVGGSATAFDPNKHLDGLRVLIAKTKNLKLVIIDSIYEQSRTKTLEIADTLRALAEEFNISIIAVMHARKSQTEAKVHQIVGSQAWGAKAEAIWCVERGRLIPVAIRYAKDDTAFPFNVEVVSFTKGKSTITSQRIAWGEPEEYDPNEDGAALRPKAKAIDALREILADGPVPEKDARAQCRALGVSDRTIERAKKDAGVITRRGENKASFWSLPDIESEAA